MKNLNLCQTQTADTTEVMWFCTICKKKRHTAQHHRDMPRIYGKIVGADK